MSAGPVFRVTIKLGNAAMLTGDDVSEALNGVAAIVPTDPTVGAAGRIYDVNGNNVGTWEVTD